MRKICHSAIGGSAFCLRSKSFGGQAGGKHSAFPPSRRAIAPLRRDGGCIPPATLRVALRAGLHSAFLHAFTLLELLVVISIIAILASMVMPTFYYAKKRAREAKARVAVKQLETAFKSYLDTYKVWPTAWPDGYTPPNNDIKDDIFKTLRGDNPSPGTPPYNPQEIAFFEFENMTNYPIAYQYTALDPWSDPSDSSSLKAYQVMFDKNYDNKITIGGQDVYRCVLVWSFGEDRMDNSGGGDDVASWK